MSGSSSESRQSMGQQTFLNWDSTHNFSSLINSNIERPTRRSSEFPSSCESKPRSGFVSLPSVSGTSSLCLRGHQKCCEAKQNFTFILDLTNDRMIYRQKRKSGKLRVLYC